MKRKNSKGITLISLVVTIIILIILAGVVITLTIGKDGIIRKALIARKEYNNSEEKTQQELENLYSSILVAGDSKVTLTMEELDEYINKKMQQPTGIKTDAYISNRITTTSAYSQVTSMTGFTRETDPNHNIDKYLSYSEERGYKVLKSGWYLIKISASVDINSGASDQSMQCFVNALAVSSLYSWAGGFCDANCDTVSIYLNEGDYIYFSSYSSGAGGNKNCSGFCCPMF